MTGVYDPRQVHAQFVDAVFAPLTSRPGTTHDAARHQRSDLANPPAAPPDAAAQPEYDWLIEERRRLEAYTHQQLALIKQQREEFLRHCTQMEESLALKGQDLNCQVKQVQSQAAAQAKRELDLGERERLLAGHEAQLTAARQLRAQIDAQRQELEATQADAAAAQEAVRFARHELAAYEETLGERRHAWQQEQADLTARQAQLEDRFRALEKAEASLQQRLREVDDLESQLRTELEEREHQLEAEYRDAAALRDQLRQRLCEAELAPVV